MIQFTFLHPRMTSEHLGILPTFFSETDPRSAREQIDETYAHGGGWNPMSKWKMDGTSIKYPGDPAMRPIATAKLRDETLYFYEHAWLAIVQPDGSYEISRVD